jgi:alpha-L-fucosidase
VSVAPEWYRAAKFGIKIHWGPSSVAGFAPRNDVSAEELLAQGGWEPLLRRNPDSRWYLNSLRLSEDETLEHHRKRFHQHASYDRIAARFNADLDRWKPEEWAELCRESGARYVVMAAKDPDGFLAWPSRTANGDRVATRDIVGGLAREARERHLRFGVAYAGFLDWSRYEDPLSTFDDLWEAGHRPGLADLVDTQYRELIDAYEPDLLWNEFGLPAGLSVRKLTGHYHRIVAEGALVNTWSAFGGLVPALPGQLGKRLSAGVMRRRLRAGRSSGRGRGVGVHRTVQTRSNPRAVWELEIGLTQSRAYNEAESDRSLFSGGDLIRLLIDVVARNGNLLVTLGPRLDGSIPSAHVRPLVELGQWLRSNGDAIYGTRPWAGRQARTTEDLPVRFTVGNDALFCIVIGKPTGLLLTIHDVDFRHIPESREARRGRYELVVSLLGTEHPVESRIAGNTVTVYLPGSYIAGPATVVKLAWEPPEKAARISGFYTDVI